jgi:uncharacterized membrane protein
MNTTIDAARSADDSSVTYTHIIYALHALSGIIGLTSGATVIGSFVFGIPSIIAVIMNYLRRDQVRGSFLESHFNWQIRTFWFALAAGVAIWLIVIVLAGLGMAGIFASVFTGGLSLVGTAGAFVGAWLAFTVGATIVGIWILYRVVRGWLALREKRAMYS